MIDWQRALDSPAFFVVCLGVALVVGGIAGSGLTFAFRKMTAQDVARKWFGEVQQEVVRLVGVVSQDRMIIEDQRGKIARARGRTRATLDDLEG